MEADRTDKNNIVIPLQQSSKHLYYHKRKKFFYEWTCSASEEEIYVKTWCDAITIFAERFCPGRDKNKKWRTRKANTYIFCLNRYYYYYASTHMTHEEKILVFFVLFCHQQQKNTVKLLYNVFWLWCWWYKLNFLLRVT